jgi:RNA polymerase sigma-B factor
MARASDDLATTDVEVLHRRYAASGEPDIEAELLRRHDRLALSVANRFAGRGEPLDDLEQVARFGLWLALTRFEPDRGLRFSTFAMPTVLGELKRYFRDRAWLVKPPRTVQERYLAIRAAADALELELAHSPTIAELAAATDLSEEAVLEGLAAGSARSAAFSLDSPVGESGDLVLHDALEGDDGGFAFAEDGLLVAALLESVPEPGRTAIALRYLEDVSQTEIADRLGVSQMTVSRTIERALDRLRRRNRSLAPA